ncbi:MAG: hypothetical protein DIAAKJNI_00124 [Candidatus Argoarchaeum ethanivorans]|uniref:Uncharacterized protein n=1 Tax=Candidatus Argoarchaeum ethanivorans TaxID=2608793 RepID=A0A811T7X0_9EURY|nr:MAG: hypothetical protein DIAAKJNI_00124 [Candidatus Argoarchaeum ethanivorans]
MTINLNCYKAKYKTASGERENHVQTPFFFSKFAADSIHTGLTAKVASNIELIDCNHWSELYWKVQLEDNLTALKAQELAALEKSNMAAIEKVHQRLKDDSEIQRHIK